MTTALLRLKSHLAGWREWELNPVVIKELRQAVRSWTVTGVLLLFLTVLFIASLGFLVSQSFEGDVNEQLGSTMFGTFVTILAGASILFIPLYTGIRIATERPDSNPDLLYVSTLTPGQIIRGKFLCGAYITVLFFSACMPFMAFTNLLRGVDLPSVFFILFALFLVVCALNQAAIFLACLPMSRPFKILIALYGFFQSFWIIVSLVVGAITTMHSGIGTMMGERNFWIATATVVSAGLAIVGLLYALSVALISPPSANRALPLRAYITFIWLLGGLLSLGWVWRMKDVRLMFVWTYLTFALMMFALLVNVSNSDQPSRRVRRRIPRSWASRIPAFIFFNGAAGGLVWVALILALTYGSTKGVMALNGTWFPKTSALTAEGKHWFVTTTAYAFAYALTALFIHRKFLPKYAPKIAGLLTVLLMGVWAILPSIVLFFLNQLSWKAVEGLQLGNIFNVFYLRDDEHRYYHTWFALAWLAVMFLINLKWFWTQVKNFRPPPPEPPIIANFPPAIATK